MNRTDARTETSFGALNKMIPESIFQCSVNLRSEADRWGLETEGITHALSEVLGTKLNQMNRNE